VRCITLREYESYSAYEFDRLTEGSQIKLEHDVYCNDTDMTDLISKSIDELNAMHEECLSIEKTAFDKVVQAAREWEPTAAGTRQVARALEYVKLPEAKHTANQWESDRYKWHSISNKVYKMSVFADERTNYRTNKKHWEVKWYIYTNSPRENYNIKVAGQDKSFPSKEDMEKYLQGRIKAYGNLFAEISPPIPDEHLQPFLLYGHLLPGYTKASEITKERDEKPSVKEKLKDLKTQIKSEPKNAPSHKRSEVQIE